MSLKDYNHIRLKPKFQGIFNDKDAMSEDPDYTPGKYKAGQWIQENIVEEDRWVVQYVDIEAEMKEDPSYDGPASRQHITNTLEWLYEGYNDSEKGGSQEMDPKPFSAAPQPESDPMPNMEFQPQPEVNGGGQYFIAFVEDGSIIGVSEIPVPETVDDINTYIQGVLAGLSSQDELLSP